MRHPNRRGSSIRNGETQKRKTRRLGVAVVELAVCLPILTLVTFATIEACAMIHLKQSLKITAYEGARVGIVPNAEMANVEYQCQTLLEDFDVNGATVQMSPSSPQALSQGDYFEVTITADFASNSLIGGWIYADKSIAASVSLRAE